MAGSVYTGYSNNTSFYFSWSLAGQEIANNRSLINWTVGLHSNGHPRWYSNAIRLNGVHIHGSSNLASGTWSNISMSPGQHLPLRSGQHWIGHESNGTRHFGASVSGWLYPNANLANSGGWNLPTIPRNSQVTTNDSGNWHIDTPLTIHTNRKSSSFSHTLTIRRNSNTGAIVKTINNVGANVVWTPSAAEITAMQNSVPNSNRVYIHIWQHNHQVNAASETALWGYISNAQPTFSNFTYRDANAATVAITGSDQILVKGKSTLETTVSAANKMVAIKGSNPSHYTFTYDGTTRQLNYSTGNVVTTFGSINTTGSRTIVTSAFDSRGNNRSVSRSVTVYDYANPTINATLARQNNFDNNTTIKISGSYSRLVIGGQNKNNLIANSLEYRYREQGGTWGSWVARPFTADTTNGTYTSPDVVVALDNTKKFDFEFRIADRFGSVSASRSVDVGLPLVYMGENNGKASVGIGVMPASGVALQVGSKFKVATDGEPNLSLTGNYTYSTSEVNTGKRWVDGKTIYRKVISIPTVTAQAANYNHGISNLSKIIHASGVGTRTSSGWNMPIPMTYTNWQIWIYDFSATNFRLNMDSNQWSQGLKDVFIILEYTKTS